MCKTKVATLVFILGGVSVACLLWFLRPTAAPSLTVAFVGFAKDSAGERMATFTLTNVDRLPVMRESHCRVEYRNDAHLVPSFHVAEPTQLDPGQVETVSVPAPSNRGPWRVGFKTVRMSRQINAAKAARSTSGFSEWLYTRLYNDTSSVSFGNWIAE
jgi:hypothetical protein